MGGIKICIVTMFLTVIYLLVTVLISNLLFYYQSNGSLVKINNSIIGSKLIGQEFKRPIYFHGRPSKYRYKNDISGSSNFPYFSNDLRKNIKQNYNDFLNQNMNLSPDLNLITESASGLDPHITYKGALSQVNRISLHSELGKEKIIEIINKKSKGTVLRLFGTKIINVLELNIELYKYHGKKTWSRRNPKTNC